MIEVRKRSYYKNLKEWWPVINKARDKHNNEEFHDIWGGDEQPRLERFKQNLDETDIGLIIAPQIVIEILGKIGCKQSRGTRWN